VCGIRRYSDNIRRKGTESSQTRRWREADSNPRSPVSGSTLFETMFTPCNRSGARYRDKWYIDDSDGGAAVRPWHSWMENAKFPASWENTGNFADSGLGGASEAAKKGTKSVSYEPIPYASEQGIFCGLAGNLNRVIREIFALIRESRSRPLFWGLCPAENPIVPTDLKRCREGERDAARCSQSLKPISSSSLVRVKAPQACRKSLAELVDAERLASRGFTMARGRVARGPGAPSSP
jgi:hypothetical protein